MKTMARPKKIRTFNGITLEDNLYPDNKGRENHWRYKRPDGTFKHFHAESTDAAIKIAKFNNERRESYTAISAKKKRTFGTLAHYVEEYINWRASQSPDLLEKSSWQKRCYALHQFCREITLPLGQIERADIHIWWDTLTGHQQRQRHAELRKFFNYLMGRELLPRLDYNPFTLADDRPRLYKKSRPARKTERLTREGFWNIYHSAGELGYQGLQIAMGISLLTFMREGDILTLKLDKDIENDLLKKTIGKSEEQKGAANASRLKWDLGNYNLLKQLIHKSRELSLQNRRCPFVISHWPKQKRLGQHKEHMAQVTPRRLISMFNDARKHAGFTQANAPTFHSIRSLSDLLATEAGYDIKEVQHAMAHSSEEMTKAYLEGHDLPFEQVNVQFSEKEIGGSF